MKSILSYRLLSVCSFCFTLIAVLFFQNNPGWTLSLEEIPSSTPRDAIMASATEVQRVLDWSAQAFTGKESSEKDSFLPKDEIPFSFIYGGISSREFLKNWSRTVESSNLPDRMNHRVQWSDPQTGLVVIAEITSFKEYPAVEWVLYFDNLGSQDTSILEQIKALDVNWQTENAQTPVIFHQLAGDACGENSFMPFQTTVEVGKPIQRKPTGGRSSSISAFPFFNLQYGNQGVITAVGWTGQWLSTLERTPNGLTNLSAGMETSHFLLHPSERIRTPRILILPWQGTLDRAYNGFRRLMLFQHVPKLDGKPIRMPVALQTFDLYSWNWPEWATEEGQRKAVQAAERLGCDTYWLDAAWFIGGFPNGVGNWEVKPKEFPNGLKPISEACHERNMRFVLWFEPERVAAGSTIAREHPEFVFGGKDDGLFKLNDPAARRWLTDLLIQRIEEYGVDVYRNDFNIDPLDFWLSNDAPDRKGITEIRYIEGLYAMWDEIRARFPKLYIDNCSSGGRRIDLETCMRSVPLWRSDTSCSPGHPDWNQVQTQGLACYVPLFTACGWTPETYDFRSSATSGALCQWSYQDSNFPWDQAKETLAEAKENQKFWYGDFYPLTACSNDPTVWMAYQFHRSDLNAGIVLLFKHRNSPYTELSIALQALNPDQMYSVDFIDESRKTTTQNISGQELQSAYKIRIPEPNHSLLIRYRPVQ